MKNKTNKKLFVGLLAITMLAMYGLAPLPNMVKAVDTIANASDTINDSDVSVTATHTVAFTSTSTIDAGYIEVVFPAPFGNVVALNVACPLNFNATAPNTETARCTAVGLRAAGAKTITITGVTNPAAEGTQYIDINHYTPLGVLIERTTVAVAIINDIDMTARIQAYLLFTVDGMTNAETVNGQNCTVNTTATTTDFGVLAPNTAKNVCQELLVRTNASDGFTVTVQQDEELTSEAGPNINSFNNAINGSGSTTAMAWASPTALIDIQNTYGHMGLTSDDVNLSTGTGYQNLYNGAGTPFFVGLNGAAQMPVFHHNGPSDGTTASVGLAHVLYRAEVSALQEAGDYKNTLTYIVTPIF